MSDCQGWVAMRRCTKHGECGGWNNHEGDCAKPDGTKIFYHVEVTPEGTASTGAMELSCACRDPNIPKMYNGQKFFADGIDHSPTECGPSLRTGANARQ